MPYWKRRLQKNSHLLVSSSLSLRKKRDVTYWVSDRHDDRVAGVLDEVDDVAVVHAGDVDVVDGQDPVSDVEPAATFRRGASNDSTNCRTRLTTEKLQSENFTIL